jgi:hypothetical protein
VQIPQLLLVEHLGNFLLLDRKKPVENSQGVNILKGLVVLVLGLDVKVQR